MAGVLRRLKGWPGVVLAVAVTSAAFASGLVSADHAAAVSGKPPSAPRGRLAAEVAPPAPAALQAELKRLADGYGEDVGLAVTDVTTGWTAGVDLNEPYPQQSVSKLWVALSVLQAVDQGSLRLDQPVVLTKADRSVFYQPVTTLIRGPEGYRTTVYELLQRQLIASDNAASDKLMATVGGVGVVTRTIADKGLDGVAVGGSEREVQTRTAGLTWQPEYGVTWIFKQARAELPDEVRDAALAAYLAAPPDGAAPGAITRALAALKRGELLSNDSTAVMLDLMGQCRTGSSRLRAGMPPGWTIAHKTGTGPDWRGASVGINDVGLMTAPDGHVYAVAVMLRQTAQPVRERLALMHAVSRAVADQWARDADVRDAD
jgi:beta-lactamase class A